jgi:hypothetical protein
VNGLSFDGEAILEEIRIRWTQKRAFAPSRYNEKGQNPVVQEDIETLEQLVSEASPKIDATSKGKLKGYISAVRLEAEATRKGAVDYYADLENIRKGRGSVEYLVGATETDSLLQRGHENQLRRLVLKTVVLLLALMRQRKEDRLKIG